MSSERWLTSKQTAQLLGVSEASIKRWADSELLQSQKTVGGHRRFRPEDVALFQREGGLGVGRRTPRAVSVVEIQKKRHATSPSKAKSSASPQTLFEALIAGRGEEVSALLVNAYLHGHSLAALFDGALSKAMRRIGELWYEGELTVAQEHIATRTALDVLQTLRRVVEVPEENGLLAICCSVEADFHELPVQCTHVLLESAGWRVLNLGPNTPFSALAEVTSQHLPQLICVSSTILTNLDRAVSEYGEFRKNVQSMKAVIVLGGAGFSNITIRKRFPATLHADSFRQLSELAVLLATQPKRAQADALR